MNLVCIKGGYLFARADGFGKKDCERQDHHNSFTACSKSVLSIAPIISVLDRLRFKPLFQYFPTETRWVIGLGAGLTFNLKY